MRKDIKFDIIDTWSATNTDIEAIAIFLKNTQDSINISTIYIPPATSINTTLIDNTKHTDFNCTKMGRWGIALEKALYNADLFIADNSIPTHRDREQTVVI